jgi:hypothetical protein
MPFELKILLCGTHESIKSRDWYFPITHIILFDPKEIEICISKQPKSVHFIVVLLNSFGQTIDSLLTEIGSKDNIVVILTCDKQFCNLTNTQTNVIYLSEHLLKCKTTLYAIRSYQSAYENHRKAGQRRLAHVLEKKRNGLKRWLIDNDKV